MSLDPKTNRLLAEEEARKAAIPPELNPPFPYRAVAIDLEALNLLTDPPVDKKAKP